MFGGFVRATSVVGFCFLIEHFESPCLYMFMPKIRLIFTFVADNLGKLF